MRVGDKVETTVEDYELPIGTFGTVTDVFSRGVEIKTEKFGFPLYYTTDQIKLFEGQEPNLGLVDNSAQENFNAKVKDLHNDLAGVAEKYGIVFLTGIYFKNEDLSGIHSYGKPNHIEEIGLAKTIEQKFLA